MHFLFPVDPFIHLNRFDCKYCGLTWFTRRKGDALQRKNLEDDWTILLSNKCFQISLIRFSLPAEGIDNNSRVPTAGSCRCPMVRCCVPHCFPILFPKQVSSKAKSFPLLHCRPLFLMWKWHPVKTATTAAFTLNFLAADMINKLAVASFSLPPSVIFKGNLMQLFPAARSFHLRLHNTQTAWKRHTQRFL